jgi:peptidoglycan/xylan/chitin deacetylase (PgdA/CDA1 family)
MRRPQVIRLNFSFGLKTVGVLLSLFIFGQSMAQTRVALKDQVASLAQKLIKDTEAAKSYAGASEALVVFSNHLKILSQEPHFGAAVCATMAELQESDLVLFQTPINEINTQIHCTESINQRVQSFLDLSKVKIKAKTTRLQMLQKFKSSPKSSFSINDPVEQLGPSIERPIDAKLGGVYFHGDLPIGHFALTFDDGPHSTLTEKLLDILKQENVQSTFFMVGERIVTSTPIIGRMVDDGHTVATHSYSHADLSRLPYEKGVLEVEDAFKALFAVIGDKMSPFFRFPYGARTRALQERVKSEGIATFFWNIDTLDWKKRDPAILFDYALEQTVTAKRGIILFHDVQPQTIAIMPEFLKALKMKGYKMEVFRQVTGVPRP